MSDRPKPIQPLVKTYNFQHIGGCPDGQTRVLAIGKTFNGGSIEFNNCVPFEREPLLNAIKVHGAGLKCTIGAPAVDRFPQALTDALVAAAASAGEVVDPESVTMRIVD